ncbi:2-dehydropantoate 2-reductase [Frigidibacter sp. MR17.14]|uniref:2-dehydropantoate 2-reductase n=1 Tax=Frigidibacter sp. MR17.14 TaxID=3126509 RepID=UPI0030131765
MTAPLKVAVLGCGAIGGWLAGALAAGGAEVSVIARGQTLEKLQAHGLTLHRGGATEQYALPAAERLDGLATPDVLIIALKAHTIQAALPAIAGQIPPGTVIATATNGIPWWFFDGPAAPLPGFRPASVDAEDVAAAMITSRGPAPVLGTVVHAAARQSAPAEIHVAKVDRLILGSGLSAHGTDLAMPISRLAFALEAGGVPVALTEDIRAEIWSKLWGNFSMNPLSVLSGATTGRMLDDPDLRALALAMMGEFDAIGAAMGVNLPVSPAERIAETRRLGDFKTSMLQDYEAGRSLEIGPIIGVVAEMAERLGIAAPATRGVLGLLRLRSGN